MIKRLAISNYKSIESAELDCRRVNVFIGEPNSGKSNLLEALALFSPGIEPGAIDQSRRESLMQLLRVREVADLFFEQEIERSAEVLFDGTWGWQMRFSRVEDLFAVLLKQPNGVGSQDMGLKSDFSAADRPGVLAHHPVRFYQYQNGPHRAAGPYEALAPPFGDNLATVLYSNRPFRERIAVLFESKGFQLGLRSGTREIFVSRQGADLLHIYPFSAISETLRRVVFYKAALETNQGAVLVLDEPEANTFPFYTTYLAERIARDETNQFFLTTHNPYVLSAIIDDTPADELAIYVTRMRDYRTEFLQLGSDDIAQVIDLGMSAFFNLEQFFPNYATAG